MTSKLALPAIAAIAFAASMIGTAPAYSAACPGAANRQVCCSARACSGRILSRRDRHNCRVKSRGKSWHAANGACVNL